MRAVVLARHGVDDVGCMARDVILLGEVAAKGAAMIELRCGRCDRHGRLSVARLLAEWGADASLLDIMREQIGSCPHRDDAQIYTRLCGRPPGGKGFLASGYKFLAPLVVKTLWFINRKFAAKQYLYSVRRWSFAFPG